MSGATIAREIELAESRRKGKDGRRRKGAEVV
jgi:hypothetical protein